MSDVLVYERASPSFAASLAQRGHHIVYRVNCRQSLPRLRPIALVHRTDKCRMRLLRNGSPSAEARPKRRLHQPQRDPASDRIPPTQRRYPRMPAKGRKLQLLIDGSPTSFALQNISEGGAMGDSLAELVPGANVYVRFEGGHPGPRRRQMDRGRDWWASHSAARSCSTAFRPDELEPERKPGIDLAPRAGLDAVLEDAIIIFPVGEVR